MEVCVNREMYLEGPIEKINEKLFLIIPLASGGDDLIDCAKGIGKVVGENLEVQIPDWLAVKLDLKEGTLVSVNNLNGKFNIVKSASEHTD